jgi:hypothetical protein
MTIRKVKCQRRDRNWWMLRHVQHEVSTHPLGFNIPAVSVPLRLFRDDTHPPPPTPLLEKTLKLLKHLDLDTPVEFKPIWSGTEWISHVPATILPSSRSSAHWPYFDGEEMRPLSRNMRSPHSFSLQRHCRHGLYAGDSSRGRRV